MAGFSFNPLDGTGLDLTGVAVGSASSRYTKLFNNTTDWVLSGPDYTFTVLAATHGKGTTPIIQLYELSGVNYTTVDVTVNINASGNVTISISSVPDLRFNGLILII